MSGCARAPRLAAHTFGLVASKLGHTSMPDVHGRHVEMPEELLALFQDVP